jgi:hypothetical protein
MGIKSLARKWQRSCRQNKTTGKRDCLALKSGGAECQNCECHAKDGSLSARVLPIYHQKDTLRRHVTGKRNRCYPDRKTGQIRCRQFERRRRQCPPGECHAAYCMVHSEQHLYSYAHIHSRQDKGAADYWQYAALEMAGQRPHPETLIARSKL